MSIDLSQPRTLRELCAAGMGPAELRRRLSAGDVRRVLRGVYVAAVVPDTQALRIRAMERVVSAGHIVCDRSAAWLHGVDAFAEGERELLPCVETCVLPAHQPTRRQGVAGHTRDLAGYDVQRLGDLEVTTPLRTALDLGSGLKRMTALAVMDGLMAAQGLTADDLRVELPRFAGRRGVVQLRSLIDLADPRAESPRESWIRLLIHDAGLPLPVPQYRLRIDAADCRLDLAYPQLRIAIEYDGEEWHRRTDAQRARDRERRRWLREHGWVVFVITKEDLAPAAVDRWLADLRTALRGGSSTLRNLGRWSPRDPVLSIQRATTADSARSNR